MPLLSPILSATTRAEPSGDHASLRDSALTR
jgi:hypothetical protein